MKFIFTLLPVCFVLGSAIAQVDAARIENTSTTTLTINSNSIYGKLVDGQTGKPIASASVQLYPVGKTEVNSLIAGMLSRPNGDFRLQRLPEKDSFYLIISPLGYHRFEKTIIIDRQKSKGNTKTFQLDLGNIPLETEYKALADVTVTSSRPALEMGIDRKIYNVEKSLVATGGTAVDIMKTIPSVTVDIDGNIELRNSTPQLFIDGRPTILTLDQIPADHIEKIELITNPSAKFDASSSGGIINVVLKKNKRIGLNGVTTISGGTPGLFSASGNLNLRQGKFNIFLSGSHNQSGGDAKGQALRQNKKNGQVTDYFNQYSVNTRSRNFNSFRFGSDFFINNRNTLTLSQDIAKGRFGSNEVQSQEYLDANQVLIRTGTRNSPGTGDFVRNSTRLNYTYKFPKTGQELTADLNYNKGNRTNQSDITNLYFKPDGTTYQTPSVVTNDGTSNETQFTFQSDYTNPINDHEKIEVGIRSFHNDFLSEYNAYALSSGQPVKLPLSNHYKYAEMINAAYFTYSYKKNNFSYQLGIRAEQSKFDGELIDSAFKFGYEYPNKIRNLWDALFPSIFLTKKLNEESEVQFNYSRKVRRPRFWELNPFIDINDPSNIRQGNPQLQPEYSNTFELNYSFTKNKNNLLAVLYFRNNPKDITQYSDTITATQFQQLNNAAIDRNAILNTYINASTTNSFGAELTYQWQAGKNLDITPTANLQYRTVNAKINNTDLSNKGFNWEGKLIANYKIVTPENSLWNNLGFQMIGEYQSPRVIPQGRRIAELSVDFAIKKEFLKDKKGSLTFSVDDLFNSRKWGTIYDTEQFYQDAYRRWNVRSFRISFTYKFGDAKFSLFKKGGGNGGDNEDN